LATKGGHRSRGTVVGRAGQVRGKRGGGEIQSKLVDESVGDNQKQSPKSATPENVGCKTTSGVEKWVDGWVFRDGGGELIICARVTEKTRNFKKKKKNDG